MNFLFKMSIPNEGQKFGENPGLEQSYGPNTTNPSNIIKRGLSRPTQQPPNANLKKNPLSQTRRKIQVLP